MANKSHRQITRFDWRFSKALEESLFFDEQGNISTPVDISSSSQINGVILNANQELEVAGETIAQEAAAGTGLSVEIVSSVGLGATAMSEITVSSTNEEGLELSVLYAGANGLAFSGSISMAASTPTTVTIDNLPSDVIEAITSCYSYVMCINNLATPGCAMAEVTINPVAGTLSFSLASDVERKVAFSYIGGRMNLEQ